MPDGSIPYYPVAMACTAPLCPPEPLPDGYAFQSCQPELEDAWCAIQCSVRAFSSPEEARRQFHSELASQPERLSRRMIFVCDRKGRAVGTAALRPERGMERICWVAVVPGLHRRGLGKALVARLMELYREEDCSGGLYLTTQTTSYRAVNIFRKFGFVPDRGTRFLERPQNEVDFLEAWSAIDKRISGYERRRSAAAAPPLVAFSGADLPEKESGARRNSLCRAFEMSAPQQSGDEPHYHDYTQVWYVTRGGCEHEVEGQRYDMSAGDVFFIPPKVIHRTRLKEGGSIICCEFDVESILSHSMTTSGKMKEITQNLSFMMLFQTELFNLQPRFNLSLAGQRQMEHLMESILEEYEAADRFFEDFLLLELLQLLLIFSREYARLPAREEPERVFAKYRDMVETAIHYIDEHFDEPLTLDGMCRISMVSKTYFCYIFKLLTHQTFVEYLMERRVERAMTLLRETDLSVMEICHAVGFREPTHFSRTFRKLRGVSPREYRGAARERRLKIG